MTSFKTIVANTRRVIMFSTRSKTNCPDRRKSGSIFFKED
jgi:hypothetical protein